MPVGPHSLSQSLPARFFENAAEWIQRREAWSRNLSAEVAAVLNRPETTDEARAWELIGPIGPPCKSTHQRVLGRMDSAKRSCALTYASREHHHSLNSRPNCHVMSIGSRNMWSFETGVVRYTPCRVSVFDCTGPNGQNGRRPWEPPRWLRNRTSFFPICIRGDRAVANTQKWRFADWATLLATAGLRGRAPDFLKMDIEGFEIEVLHSIVRPGVDASSLPTQIALEVHTVTNMKDAAFFGRKLSHAEVALFFDRLWRHGRYAVISRHDSKSCPTCTELLLSRLGEVDEAPKV